MTSEWPSGVTARSVILVAPEPPLLAVVHALPGIRVVGRLAWDELAGDIEQATPADLVIADARGSAEEVLAEALPALDRFVRDAPARLIAALTPQQIDLVAGQLLGPQANLLCDPSDAELAAAVTLAGALGGPTMVREHDKDDSEKLRRLVDEVSRIATTLAELSARQTTPASYDPGALRDRTPGYRAKPALNGQVDAQEVRGTIRARRLRDQFFDGNLFEDPAWDMLLDLYAAELDSSQVSVSSLCIAAAVAPTTALRWIGRLTEAGLFERQPDPFDRRRAFMALTPMGREAMRGYMVAVKQAGLPIA